MRWRKFSDDNNYKRGGVFSLVDVIYPLRLTPNTVLYRSTFRMLFGICCKYIYRVIVYRLRWICGCDFFPLLAEINFDIFFLFL